MKYTSFAPMPTVTFVREEMKYKNRKSDLTSVRNISTREPTHWKRKTKALPIKLSRLTINYLKSMASRKVSLICLKEFQAYHKRMQKLSF